MDAIQLRNALSEVVDVDEWLEIPNDEFDGQKPIELLNDPMLRKKLWEMVYRLRSGQPG